MTERKKRPMTIERAMEKLRKMDEAESIGTRHAIDALAARFDAKRAAVLAQLSDVERDAVKAAREAIRLALG